MPTVAVKPELIRWAIDRSGLSADDLLKRFPSSMSGPAASANRRFGSSIVRPRNNGAVWGDVPRCAPAEELPVPDFRTRNDARLERYSPNLLETMHTMQRRQAWLRMAGRGKVGRGSMSSVQPGPATTSSRWPSGFASAWISMPIGPRASLAGKTPCRRFARRSNGAGSSCSVTVWWA